MSAGRHHRVRPGSPTGSPAPRPIPTRPESEGPVDRHIRRCGTCDATTDALELDLCTECRRGLGWEDDEVQS